MTVFLNYRVGEVDETRGESTRCSEIDKRAKVRDSFCTLGSNDSTVQPWESRTCDAPEDG